MTNDALLVAAILGPPAVFGILIALEGFLDRWRHRRMVEQWSAEDEAAARSRHPSAWDGS